MSYPQLTVIAYDTSNSIDILKPIHHMDFLSNSEIHFVHIVKRIFYGDGISFNVSFPDQDDQSSVCDAIISSMKDFAPDILPNGHVGKVKFQCLFGDDPMDEFCKYLESTKADLALISSRERHGIFDSSFAYYVSTHACCSVLVSRTKES